MAVTVKPSSDLKLALRLGSKLAAENPGAFGVKRGYDGEDRFYLKPGETYFADRVQGFTSRTVQIMSDEWADDRVVFVLLPDGEVEEVNLGYSSDADFNCDATPELLVKMQTRAAVVGKLETGLAQARADVERYKPALRKGSKALAFKGRKVAIGTEVEIFWSGTTYNKWTHNHDHRLGIILPNGAKEWVAADNFEPLPTVIEVQDYASALALLKQAEAALANPLGHREPVEDYRSLIPPRVAVRELVRAAFGDEAVDQEVVEVGEG